MKCLSIRPPWAELILRGIKDCENRSWYTPHRGPLIIHASKTLDHYGLDVARDNGLEPTMPHGCILGRVDLVNCMRKCSSDWHDPDQFGWYVENPVIFEEPIPWRGQLGLFDIPDHKLGGLEGVIL